MAEVLRTENYENERITTVWNSFTLQYKIVIFLCFGIESYLCTNFQGGVGRNWDIGFANLRFLKISPWNFWPRNFGISRTPRKIRQLTSCLHNRCRRLHRLYICHNGLILQTNYLTGQIVYLVVQKVFQAVYSESRYLDFRLNNLSGCQDCLGLQSVCVWSVCSAVYIVDQVQRGINPLRKMAACPDARNFMGPRLDANLLDV